VRKETNVIAEFTYTAVNTGELAGEYSRETAAMLMAACEREARQIADEIEEIQGRDYWKRPPSKLLQGCRFRWLTDATGTPIGKHSSVPDMIGALEVCDDQTISYRTAELARLLDLIAVCEELMAEGEASND
jgi:hypothetical protein